MDDDTPHGLRTHWPEMIDMSEIFNEFIVEHNIKVDMVDINDNITGGKDIVRYKMTRQKCIFSHCSF